MGWAALVQIIIPHGFWNQESYGERVLALSSPGACMHICAVLGTVRGRLTRLVATGQNRIARRRTFLLYRYLAHISI